MNETIPILKDSVEQATKRKAIEFVIWMEPKLEKQNLNLDKLYDEFSIEYDRKLAAKFQNELKNRSY